MLGNVDYSDVKSFSSRIDPIMIRLAEIPNELQSKTNIVHIRAPEMLMEMYHTLRVDKCLTSPYIEPLKPAQLQSKLHQMAQGNVITDEGTVVISRFKAETVYHNHHTAVVFYKYIADREQLLHAGFREEEGFLLHPSTICHYQFTVV